MKTILTMAAVMVTLTACSSVTPVTTTGPNSYMVGSNAHGGFTSDTEVKALAVNRANEFCAAQGKMAQVTSSSSSGVQMWTPQNSEVNFTCVAKP